MILKTGDYSIYIARIIPKVTDTQQSFYQQ